MRRALFVLALWAGAHIPALAAERIPPVDSSPAPIARGSCRSDQDYQKEGYTVRSVRVKSPFSGLPWLRARMDAGEKIAKELEGTPFGVKEAIGKVAELRDLNFPPQSGEQRVRILLVVTTLERCDGKQLDIVYSVYSSQLLPSFVSSIESLNAATAKTAGADEVTGRLRFTPRLNYGSSQNLMGGGRLDYAPGQIADGLVGNMAVNVSDSSTAHDRSLTLSGAKEHTDDVLARWLAHSEWQLDYRDQLQPSDESKLNTRRLSAQWLALTPPLGKWQLPIRFGGAIDSGKLESTFMQAQLAPDSVRSANYNSVKLFLGTTGRKERSGFSASYGVEAGMIGSASRPDWVKHVVDLSHEVTVPTKDAHRPVEIESRFTAGHLQVKGSVPAATRFFGGNREDAFISGDSWSMRSNPFIRSIPSGKFGRENGGAGGTRFAAINLTVAYPVWNEPLVPNELAKTREVQDAIVLGIKTATNLLATQNLARDKRRKPILDELFSGFREGLATLLKDVTAARSSSPNVSQALFQTCISAVGKADKTAEKGLGWPEEGDTEEQLDRYVTLLLPYTTPEDVYKPGQINEALTACVKVLNGEVGSDSIAQDGKRLADMLTSSRYKELKAEAQKVAAEELEPAGHTVRTLFNEVNTLSISPVLMFDAARMDSDRGLITRYGVGLGIRATVTNSVDFTLGYVANPRRVAGDSAGAFFFTMQIRDLF